MEEINLSKKQFHDLVYNIRLEMAYTRDPEKIKELNLKLAELKKLRARTVLKESGIIENEKGWFFQFYRKSHFLDGGNHGKEYTKRRRNLQTF